MDISQNESLRDKDFRLANVLRRMGEAKNRAKGPGTRAGSVKNTKEPVGVAQPIDDITTSEASDRWPLPGLAPMTRVRTSFGDVHAVALRKGDKVQARDGNFYPIVWLNRVLLDAEFLEQKPDSHPMEIRAGAVARGVPSADIMVSPRQIICPAGTSGQQTGCEAARLDKKPGISRKRETGLSYTMFHLGAPADVLCEGIYLRFSPEK